MYEPRTSQVEHPEANGWVGIGFRFHFNNITGLSKCNPILEYGGAEGIGNNVSL
jgi:hypothetical protein